MSVCFTKVSKRCAAGWLASPCISSRHSAKAITYFVRSLAIFSSGNFSNSANLIRTGSLSRVHMKSFPLSSFCASSLSHQSSECSDSPVGQEALRLGSTCELGSACGDVCCVRVSASSAASLSCAILHCASWAVSCATFSSASFSLSFCLERYRRCALRLRSRSACSSTAAPLIRVPNSAPGTTADSESTLGCFTVIGTGAGFCCCWCCCCRCCPCRNCCC
mmetsp:Transcript_7510/g.22199  ORF Transcript_7510/g.22199 Transcript_7510/m.22199 type:complete len:221 (-) Transcript_7510:100-762(-)